MPLLALCCMAAALLPPPLAEGRTFPQVTRVESNNGPQPGGNAVTIRGVGFASASAVRFGEEGASFAVESDTQIRASAPAGSGEADIRVSDAQGEVSPAVPADRYAYDPAPAGPWLGLNGNSLSYVGPVEDWVRAGAPYDRSGSIEWTAGETLARSDGAALWNSISAGEIPVITIEFRGYSQCSFGTHGCLPAGAAISTYVRGFIVSARAILARYPAAPILFEATNEPWGYGSASQYAAILAELLPAAAQAGLPLDRIYAGATNKGWIGALYAARPELQTEIKGWYLHPYNAEHGGEGIPSLPGLQAEMTSGQNNLIVSEMGFCAPDVNGAGDACPPPRLASAAGARALRSELRAALPFHEDGWLRALLVYSRNDAGWAMQLRGGRLTGEGHALLSFVEAAGGS